MIRVEQVSKRLRGQLILDEVSLEVPEAAVVTVLGPSGAGKTVLLKIVAGIMAPDSGRVFYDGQELTYGRFADNKGRTGKIGFVFQGGALFDWMNVADNIALPLRERTGLSGREIEKRVGEVLKRVGMDRCGELPVRELSGGMMRLVAIARALITEPKYIFFDEPTSGLDPLLRERVCDLIGQLPASGKRSAVVVTHDLEVAKRLADRFYILRGCRLILSEEVKKEDYEPAGA
ncbi:MAG: ABC transporter ATP-binding protein [bacterium]